MNHSENAFSAKSFFRQAVCLAALLLASIGNIQAQISANNATGQNSVTLPKLPLLKAKTVTFNLHHFVWGQVPNGEPDQEQLDDVAVYVVQIQFPMRLRILDITSTYPSRLIKDNKGQMHGILPRMSYVGDEKQQLEWDKTFKVYKTFKAAHTLLDPGQEVDSLSLISPNILFTPDALKALKFKADGTDIIGGKTTAVYRQFLPNEGETVVYLDPKTRLPLRISNFGPDRQGDRAEMARTDFSNWQFNVKFPPNTFDTTPPAGFMTRDEKLKEMQKKLGK